MAPAGSTRNWIGFSASGTRCKDAGTPETFREARIPSEGMIQRGEFDPI